MSIQRSAKLDSFTVVNNVGINDARLSFKAKGLLVFLLSKPDTWRTNGRLLAKVGPDGVDAVFSALKELEDCGYLIRERVNDKAGNFSWDSIVYDSPQTVLPCMVLPCMEKPDSVVNTNKVNTELVNTEKEEDSLLHRERRVKKPVVPPKSEAVKLFREFTNRWPNKAGQEWVDLNVTDLELWRTVLGEWLTRGYSPVNVKGMVEWYNQPANYAKKTQRANSNATAFENFERELKEKGLWSDS